MSWENNDDEAEEAARLDREYQANQRRWAEEDARRRADSATMALAGVACLLVTASLGGWWFWQYLQLGVWPPMTARSLFHWDFTSEWVGLQNIGNWFLDLWIGWYPGALGSLFVWAGLQDYWGTFLGGLALAAVAGTITLSFLYPEFFASRMLFPLGILIAGIAVSFTTWASGYRSGADDQFIAFGGKTTDLASALPVPISSALPASPRQNRRPRARKAIARTPAPDASSSSF